MKAKRFSRFWSAVSAAVFCLLVASSVPAHAQFGGSQIVFDLHLQMKADFIIQFAIQPVPNEQTPKPRGKHPRPTHIRSFASTSGAEPRNRSMVDDMRCQSLVSFVSCRRPAALME